jgi:hypothetical protein
MMISFSGIMQGISGKFAVSAEKMAARAAKFEAGAARFAQREAEFGIRVGHFQTKTGDVFSSVKGNAIDKFRNAKQFLKDDWSKSVDDFRNASQKLNSTKKAVGDRVSQQKAELGIRVGHLETKMGDTLNTVSNKVGDITNGVKQGIGQNVDAFVANRAMSQLNKSSAAEFGGLFRQLTGEQKLVFQQQASGISDYNKLASIAKGILGA